MNPHRLRSTRKESTPLERVTERLEADVESAWYAERLEILGRIMFGDLWKPKEASAPHPDAPPSPRSCGEGNQSGEEKYSEHGNK